MLERKLHDGPSPLFEAAPRPRRSRPALRERIPSPEVAPCPPNRVLALRVHIPSSEPESRFSSLNRASRIRIPLPGLAFRSSGSRSTPWVCSRSPDSNLASRLAFRPPNPNSAPPVHTLLCEPKCRSFGSRSPSKLECRTFGSRSALRIGISLSRFALALRTRVSPNPSGRLKPHHRISPCLHHRISPYLHRMFHVKHSFAHRKPCLAPPPHPLCSCDPAAALRFAR